MFFIDPPASEIYTLSLHDALPISPLPRRGFDREGVDGDARARVSLPGWRHVPFHERRELRSARDGRRDARRQRSEEHTSELQSRLHLVCRLLLEKKNTATTRPGVS